MRILLANSFYAPEFAGGAERVLHTLACGLIAHGAQVAAFTTGETQSVDVVDGVTVYRFPIDNGFRKYDLNLPGKIRRGMWQVRDLHSRLMARRFEQVMRECQPDVVHFHNLSGLTRSIWAVPAKLGVPSVQVLHDLYLICPSSSMFKRGHSCRSRCATCRLFRTGFANASRQVSAVVGVSAFVLQRVRAERLFPTCEHRVIYNAVGAPQPGPLPGGLTLRFGFIGALTPHKGIAWLIRQFSNDMGELRVAGQGSDDYLSHLKDLAKDKAITFLGYCPSDSFLPQIDVCIVPSVWRETLSSVAIESASHGRPVIASRRGGLPEVVRDGQTGILVDPDQPDSLAQAMRRLAGDRELVNAMAVAAPQAVAHLSDFGRFLGEYDALHRHLIARHAHGPSPDGAFD